MYTTKATFQDGQLRFAHPLDIPEGTELEVTLHVYGELLDRLDAADPLHGNSPEAIARWIEMMDAIQPTMTDEQWEADQRRRKEDREWQLAHAEERALRLQKLFDKGAKRIRAQ